MTFLGCWLVVTFYYIEGLNNILLQHTSDSLNFSSAPAPHSNQPPQEGPHTSTDHGRVPLNDISQLNHSSKKPYLCVSPGIWRPASQPANPTRNNTPGLLKNSRRCCLFNPVPIRLDRLPIHWGINCVFVTQPGTHIQPG